MDVGVLNGLARGSSIIYSDIECIHIEFHCEQMPQFRNEGPEVCLFPGWQGINALHVLTWDHESMTFRERECVPECYGTF